MIMKKTTSGFTIVELLIVIVVIGILAAITIVAFNGIQERARYTTMQSDIGSVNKAIMAYKALNDSYPYPSGSTGNYYSIASSAFPMTLPGLVPDFISTIPVIPSEPLNGNYVYIASPGGADYKLLRLMPGGTTGLPSNELTNKNLDYRVTTSGERRGWGFWSPGGSGL